MSGTQVVTTVAGGGDAIGVNPATGHVYVANYYSNTITVLNGIEVIGTLAVGAGPQTIAVNPATGLVYVGNRIGHSITILREGPTFKTFLPVVLKNH
jgi:YVTN family beta-propeller protein